MTSLRRARGRNEVILGVSLLLLGTSWFGWRHMVGPAFGESGAVPTQSALAEIVAQAADLRAQMDEGGDATELIGQIRRLLTPVGAQTEPQNQEASGDWRRGLAMLVDVSLLASQAGDVAAETTALSLMRNYCPSDAWSCYFQIPEKALATVRAGTLDDHARVAMLTATGFLYAKTGDRVHCDALQRKAILVYGDLLETYDGWGGRASRTFTPQGRLKAIGTEYYDYRNRMDRLAMYSADYWGMAVVDGRCSLGEALSACDHKLFRASVRIRADRQTDPITILHEELVRELDFSTIASWYQSRAYGPQADWERERGALIQRIGEEEVAAVNAIAQARKLAVQNRNEDALVALEPVVQTEPSLAETGVSLRCEMVSVLMNLHRYQEALGFLDEAEGALYVGDPRLRASTVGYLQGRIGYYRMRCRRGAKDNARAVEAGEQVAGDTNIPVSFRAHTLLELMQIHIEGGDRAGALDAYSRLTSLSGTPAQSQTMLEPLVQVAQERLAHRGWFATTPVASGIPSAR